MCCLLSEVFLDTVRDGGIGHGEEATGRCPRCEPLPCSVTMGTTFIAADADSTPIYSSMRAHTHTRRVMDKILTVLDTGLCGQQAIQCGSHKTIHTVIEMTTYHIIPEVSLWTMGMKCFSMSSGEWASATDLRLSTALSLTTVSSTVARLSSGGWGERGKRRGGAHIYSIVLYSI